MSETKTYKILLQWQNANMKNTDNTLDYFKYVIEFISQPPLTLSATHHSPWP